MALNGLIQVLKLGSKNNLRFYSKAKLKSSPKQKPSHNNRLYAFGSAEHGALGLYKPGSETKQKRFIMKPVRHFFAEEHDVIKVSSGFGFTAYALKTKEKIKLYGSGVATDEQIGKQEHSIIKTPVPIDLDLECSDTQIISLSAGRAHLGVVTDKEGTFMLGNNFYGQCGTTTKTGQCNCPVTNCIKCVDGKKVKHVICGQDHTIFIAEGKVFSCGWGADGQTGLESTKNTTKPTQVKGAICGENIIKVAGKCDTVLALNDKGELFGWGSNEYSQLSDKEDTQQINKPIKLEDVNLNCGKIIDMAAGGTFCIALNDDGNVFVWGYGILGGGPKLEKCYTPFQIPNSLFGNNELDDNATVKSVYCGVSHFMAVNSKKHVFAWGKNRHGCLGIGHTRDQYFPYKLALSALASHVSCGLDHTMILGAPIS